ncbi:S8 family serine peptidase [Streptomyces sp. NBC_00193]|uniref:S8 family peptidase n=1 Tax=Streptomyces sp. NBC_00193 TaxID=2975675 RepID=UPI00224EC2D7|nr:S8 family serine peptidase [Streptomyces sp. NBC_00193]MCX5295679.1 S8 family serine peptidase [Streptomyces sp. NBC_00193]
MRNHHSRAGAAASVAAAAALALAAGLTTPAAAAPATGSSGAGAGARSAAPPAPATRITLVTGDRVVLAADGRPVSLERAEGRARIPFSVHTENGRTSVVPYDAQPLIRAGKLDPRLFDITELSRPEYLARPSAGLQLIVGYEGPAAAPAAPAAARSALRAADGVEVTRSYPTLDAEAVTATPVGAAALWEALTDPRPGAGGRAAAPGIARVWLDAVRTATLDRSTRQIGADKAWAAGYDGTGVKIAVLDTGIDATHADLAGQVVAEQNFSRSADAVDRVGHGTHVASIAAGTGARSAGAFKGVAPGAKLLSGKVLDDGGSGNDSGILAGMEWAVAQGADIVNLSLGRPDTPQLDPVEAAVDRISAEKGVLFAVAAGNRGRRGPGTIDSPGSANAALTVGAVDDADALAPFSGTGPLTGGGGVKPDVTAPGVDITAAAAPGSVIDREEGQNPAGYLTISGTSMATPHVAGAAALLKQQHPDWKGPELKGALTGSAKGGAHTPYQQGTGRIAVDGDPGRSVVVLEGALAFDTQRWPHADDTPQSRKITYRNLGGEPVTLDLAVAGSAPGGAPAPEGFFTLGARRLTVPAGGTAETALTVDTRLGGSVDGTYSAYATATIADGLGAGGQVRTAAVAERELESYDLTLRHLGRDGRPAEHHTTTVQGVRGAAATRRFEPHDPSGTVTLRVPRGGYLLDATVFVDPFDLTKGTDWIVQPQLEITSDTTVTLDARTTRPVEITVPSKTAQVGFATPAYTLREGDAQYHYSLWLNSIAGLRTRQLGPRPEAGTLSQQWDVHWDDGASVEYHAVLGGPVSDLATGYTRHLGRRDLATLVVGQGASAPGKRGAVVAMGSLPGSRSGSTASSRRPLPTTATLHVSTLDGATWDLSFTQGSGYDDNGVPRDETTYEAQRARTFKGGRTYHERFNAAVFGPKVDDLHGVWREGASISGSVPLLADGANHAGGFYDATGSTVLRRNGVEVGRSETPLESSAPFAVPPGEASYELTTTTRLRPELSATSSETTATWRFRSKETAEPTPLPVSAVRFDARPALDGTLPAGRTENFPVTVQGPAATDRATPRVQVSYDEGRTWSPLRVHHGRVEVRTPEKGGTVSLRGTVTDRSGNTSEVTVLRAYLAG